MKPVAASFQPWLLILLLFTASSRVLAQDRMDTWDLHLRAHWSFHFSIAEISSAVLLPPADAKSRPSILAFPDSPPLPSLRHKAFLLDPATGRERILEILPPFDNQDIECAVFDEAGGNVIAINSGSSRRSRTGFTGYIMRLDDIAQGRQVPCREFELSLPGSMVEEGLFADVEAAFLAHGFMYLVEKPLSGGDPGIVAVALEDLEGGVAQVKAAGTLPLITRDGLPMLEWVTDAYVLNSRDDAGDVRIYLYFLGYSGVYSIEIMPISGNGCRIMFDPSGIHVVLQFPGCFIPEQTRLSEALLITGPGRGFVIKESGRNARGAIVNSPAFAFEHGMFIRGQF